jgi:ankyrin repeat protein
LSNGAEPAVVLLLLQRRPEAARGVDARGWTPLHVAASMGADVSIVKALLEAHPAAVVMRTKKGSSVIKCLHKQCPDRAQLKELLVTSRREFDANFRSPLVQRMPSTDSLELC